MRNLFHVVLAVVVMAWAVSMSYAAEHGGKEHGGTATKEHGGAAAKEHGGTANVPSADDIRAAMTNYVLDQSRATGTFDVVDPETGKARKLELIRVHERVGKTGDYYYSCADFKDTETGQMLDLDLDVEDKGGKLSVVDVRIHKLEGTERYTYDENDNRIPLNAEGSHMEGSHVEGSHMEGSHMEGSHMEGQEQGDKEHGGTTHKEHGGK